MARSGDKLEGIQSRIPADLIIRAMVGLLEARHQKKIGRVPFLKTWGKLRRLLALTPEYARWRWNVKNRAGGACERCAEPGNHAHHKEPVARNPARALDLANGEYLCLRCHRAEHRRSPKPATSRRDQTASRAAPLPARSRTQPPTPRR